MILLKIHNSFVFKALYENILENMKISKVSKAGDSWGRGLWTLNPLVMKSEDKE
jgi:hypothetical protein